MTIKNRIILGILPLIVIITGACGLGDLLTDEPDLPQAIVAPTPLPIPTPTPIPGPEITFAVTCLNAPPGGSVYLNILDEVTGLAFNQVHYPLQKTGNNQFGVTLPLPAGSIIKYRYSLQAVSSPQEFNADGSAIRYRVYYVTGKNTLQDTIVNWGTNPLSINSGKIAGNLINVENGKPAPGQIVTVDGFQTISLMDGSYQIDGIPEGSHNLTVYAPDGAYTPFQQGAVINSGAVTRADVSLSPAPPITVTFEVDVPEETPNSVPLRIAGNLYQFGNTFADLSGGINTLASRMPVMSSTGKGHYTYRTTLPSGSYLKYKYTLGDGFWNSEQYSSHFYLREIVLPQSDITIRDKIYSWRSDNSAPVKFRVDVPANTPKDNFISLQINPYGWTEPLPIWPDQENRWTYTLYNPLNADGNISYRYCRNDLCGFADDVDTRGPNAHGYPLASSWFSQDIQDDVTQWTWLQDNSPTEDTGSFPGVNPRGNDFFAGVEMNDYYHPSWLYSYTDAFKDVAGLGSNWVIVSPTWSLASISPFKVEQKPGVDPGVQDLSLIYQNAGNAGLSVATYPRLVANTSQGPIRSIADSETWFPRYRRYILHFADFAQASGSKALILRSETYFPPGTGENEMKWRDLINEIRAHFSGLLVWAMEIPDGQAALPPFIDSIDYLYIQLSPQTYGWDRPANDPDGKMAYILDEVVFPLAGGANKPIIIGAAFPSAGDVTNGCLKRQLGECLDPDLLAYPNNDIPELKLNLPAQEKVYYALLKNVSQHDWIKGFVSRGYFPPIAIQDKSSSIHGKPASEIIKFYFPRLRTNP